ncbi:hypothetical protein RhiirC2_305360 [Rhizophagus irregularis]|uniref:Uncharacterized protein n=1 Tax=Rhizophagus irregularis TaxID=588596 RepID=A0A2N1P119_9GLOM|nr:hypothetical protein RhiirC2_305360 [Rhizophagus irregularis]
MTQEFVIFLIVSRVPSLDSLVNLLLSLVTLINFLSSLHKSTYPPWLLIQQEKNCSHSKKPEKKGKKWKKVPSFVRSTVIGRITVLMGRWNDQDLDYGTDAIAILGQNIAKESDFWVRPRHRPDPPAGSGQGVNGKDKA